MKPARVDAREALSDSGSSPRQRTRLRLLPE